MGHISEVRGSLDCVLELVVCRVVRFARVFCPCSVVEIADWEGFSRDLVGHSEQVRGSLGIKNDCRKNAESGRSKQTLERPRFMSWRDPGPGEGNPV